MLVSLIKPRQPWRNRTGSVQAEPYHRPEPVSFEEIQSEVMRAAEEGERLRVAGSGSALSPLCWTDETLLSLRRYHGIERWSADRQRIWVRAGTRLGALGTMLAREGLALEHWNGSAAQTLGGALATGASGGDHGWPCLAAQVTGVHMICADGSARTVNAETNTILFDSARLSLGTLGVVTHAELRVVPAFRLLQRQASAQIDDVMRHLRRHLQSNRSFSFRWFPYTGAVLMQFTNITDAPAQASRPLQDLRRNAWDGAQQWLLAQAARRLPSAAENAQRLGSTHRAAAEKVLESHRVMPPVQWLPYQEIEYVLPLEHLEAALGQMQRVIAALKFSAHLPLQIRFAQADSLWLSPAHGRDSACIAVRAPLGSEHADYFAAMTEIADRYDARPAWGSGHGKTARELAPLYPRWRDFQQLRAQLDPHGVFLNPHLISVLGTESS